MVTFRGLTESDFDLLADWLGREHVQVWWRDPSAPASVAEKYGPRVRGETPTQVFVVRVAECDVGIIQRYRIADHPAWLGSLAKAGFDASDSAGIDYLLGDPGMLGRGVGTEMIRAFTDELFDDLDDVTSVIVTPQAANTGSCRALEKAGFERRWTGMLDSGDLSDDGEAALYLRFRHP